MLSKWRKARKDKAQEEWQRTEGLVIDVFYHRDSPRANLLSPFALIRFIDRHQVDKEVHEQIITVELPQPGSLLDPEMDKGFSVDLLYRWEYDPIWLPPRLEVKILSFGNTPLKDPRVAYRLQHPPIPPSVWSEV